MSLVIFCISKFSSNGEQHSQWQILNLIQTSTGALNFNDALIAFACRDLSILAIASFDTDFDRIPWLHRLSRAGDITMITPPPK